MSLLIDTNVLLRLADQQSSEHTTAVVALDRLLLGNEPLFISAQVLVEVWSVATRPESANGLGWSIETAEAEIRMLQRQFPLLDEIPGLVERWLELVTRGRVVGKRTHDARLAALILSHDVPGILTFNTSDFPPSWGVHALHPEQVAGRD